MERMSAYALALLHIRSGCYCQLTLGSFKAFTRKGTNCDRCGSSPAMQPARKLSLYSTT